MATGTRRPAIRLELVTEHPSDYVLLNERNGSRWRGTDNGVWIRARPAALRALSDAQIKQLREAYCPRVEEADCLGFARALLAAGLEAAVGQEEPRADRR